MMPKQEGLPAAPVTEPGSAEDTAPGRGDCAPWPPTSEAWRPSGGAGSHLSSRRPATERSASAALSTGAEWTNRPAVRTVEAGPQTDGAAREAHRPVGEASSEPPSQIAADAHAEPDPAPEREATKPESAPAEQPESSAESTAAEPREPAPPAAEPAPSVGSAEAEEPVQPSSPPEPPPLQDSSGGAYRVALDAYSGPLDLLLYLIRKDEVDICDIPVARVAQQYLGYIELLREINVNIAGEFLVMAATLMELKSRMLLPTEEIEEEEGEDPRAELVRQLLEYKRFKDAARHLGDRAEEQARKLPRPGSAVPDLRPLEDGDTPDRFLEGVGLWELVDAFAKVVRETSLGGPTTRTLERERPLHEFRRDLLRMLGDEESVAFSRIFVGLTVRQEKIAMFIALLELVRLKRIILQQPSPFGEIYLALSDGSAPPPVYGPAVAEQPEAERPRGARWDAAAVQTTRVIDEIESESDALGQARERVDAAIERAEWFLDRHHQTDDSEAPGEAPPPRP
jgi:segregation and condensation protein A